MTICVFIYRILPKMHTLHLIMKFTQLLNEHIVLDTECEN